MEQRAVLAEAAEVIILHNNIIRNHHEANMASIIPTIATSTQDTTMTTRTIIVGRGIEK